MPETLTIQTLKEKIIPLLKKEGVIRSSLFGSYAREEATPSSDVDILVELPEDRSLLDLVSLEFKLEDILQKKVDLLTFNSIHHLLKPYIEKDLVPIL